MADARILPAWAEDLRRRYLRNAAVLFILHGTVHASVLVDGPLHPPPPSLPRAFWHTAADPTPP